MLAAPTEAHIARMITRLFVFVFCKFMQSVHDTTPYTYIYKYIYIHIIYIYTY